MPNLDSLLKVRLPAEVWGGDVDETVWAEPVSLDRVRLKNVPFFSYGVNYDDVLRVCDGSAVEISIRSGHSTYRFFVKSGQLERALGGYWQELAALGCTHERATEHLVSVDVPPTSDIHAVYQALQTGENAGVWEFEEGSCGHAV